ncbi:MAG: outer membrane beta-barrel protein [Gammaproteobacteria bacterium]|nr:outer membrane beta-barrel protein [Gammaproteobacteria bacterium]
MSGLTFGAHAEPQTGWYVGADAGIGTIDVNEGFWTDGSITNAEIDKSGAAYHLYAGYRLHRHFALEVGYLNFADTVFSGNSNGVGSIWNAGPIEGRTEIRGLTMQGVGLWPLDSLNLTLFVKGGLFMWDSLALYSSTINDIHHFNDDGGSLLGGVGAEINAWGGWRIRGGVDVTGVGLANREMVTATIATIGVMHPLY